MGGIRNSTHFYRDKPLFGLDIGFSSIKVMQIVQSGKQQVVVGHGVGDFDSSAIENGIIVNHEVLAKSALDLFKNNIIGQINTRRVAVAIPATRTFTRTMNMPALPDGELAEAVRLEAEQYIPVPIDQLYMDYSIIDRSEKSTELLAVGVPKKIVDSYTSFVHLLGLEPVVFDTSINAASRLFEKQDTHDDIPAVLIDFGSISTDITIHDKTVIVTGTLACGGDTFTDRIAQKLNVTHAEAHLIKTKYGMGKSKKQAEIMDALLSDMEQLVREVRRMIRYYEERSGTKEKIGQVVTMGGGAHMQGLSEYLTSILRLPARMCDPWQDLQIGKLKPPTEVEKSLYVTVAGLALIEPKELFL
jgi:type IV pilus assembly protein PilM